MYILCVSGHNWPFLESTYWAFLDSIGLFLDCIGRFLGYIGCFWTVPLGHFWKALGDFWTVLGVSGVYILGDFFVQKRLVTLVSHPTLNSNWDGQWSLGHWSPPQVSVSTSRPGHATLPDPAPGTQTRFLLRTPGVDVMITIFCDCRQFSAKKLAFFSKTNVMINILQNLALF
jgi:hypothetical protein